MRILLYVTIILMGAVIGAKDMFSSKIISKLSQIQTGCLLILLFIMGLNIGVNKEIVRTFFKLGYQGIILALFSILFSILGVKLISRVFPTQEEGECEHDR
ncbi:LysO family transporter [Geosporobacter ferrireducens]|uniref:DUF340 domain-containing protein n=1 Tax=Geosporobacter ferrireducens TaxID=1424294 RepID=A0A1D8GPR2_9FIRM|nr:LysO family transporter [Geosporobacter ferrireducens]AOT72863.1 hypothetical protein Gferi_26890 [Geosporobacter ferrireducens]MTI55268.1 lysine exporter LysO family protein [Geosporobacter ferrireducens]